MNQSAMEETLPSRAESAANSKSNPGSSPASIRSGILISSLMAKLLLFAGICALPSMGGGMKFCMVVV